MVVAVEGNGSHRFLVSVAGLIRPEVDRHRNVGAVLGHQDILNEPELFTGALEQSREVQFLLIDLHLQTVNVIAHRGQAFTNGALLPAKFRQFLVLQAALRLGGGQRHPSLRNGAVNGIQNGGQGVQNALRAVQLAPADDRPTGGILGGGTLRLELRGQLRGTQLLSANALARCLHLESGLHLPLAGDIEFGGQPITSRHVEHRPRAGLRRLEFCARVVGRGNGILDGLSGETQGTLQALSLAIRGFNLHSSAVQQFSLGGQLGVKLAEAGQRAHRLLLGGLNGATLFGERELGPLDERNHLGETIFRGIPIGNEFEARTLRPRTPTEHKLAENIASLSDDRHRRRHIL